MNYKISKHAQERYAERIMEKDSALDINTFIQTHEDKIKTDIEKMIEFGTILFEGKSFSEYNKKNTRFILCGTWIVILDPTGYSDGKEYVDGTVITLYKRDLGLGEDFNKEYIQKLWDKYNDAKQRFDDTAFSIEQKKEEYKKAINDGNDMIAEYRKQIKSIEESNRAYQTLIDEANNETSRAETEVREILGSMVGRRTY